MNIRTIYRPRPCQRIPDSFQSHRAPMAYGFTLVELLVVVAIIGILVGLLLPAVQAAREAARRCSCGNNLLQSALATQHYEFSMGHLPPGVENPDGPIRSEPIGKHVSWTVQVLPFMEESAVYNHFDQDAGSYAPANLPVRKVSISVFSCPSSPQTANEDHEAISNYAGSSHSISKPIDADNDGLLFLNSNVNYRDISDGSSHTILIGEVIGFHETKLGWTSGTRATLRNAIGINSEKNSNRNAKIQTQESQAKPAEQDPLYVGGYSSFHPGGAQFAFADGSIRFISETASPNLLRQMANRSDGELPAE